VNLVFLQFVPTDCVMEINFKKELMIMTLVPLILSFLFFFAFSLYSSLNIAEKDQLRNYYYYLFLLLTFIVFSPLSTKIFQAFDCDHLDDGKSYLRADYSIDCSSSEYNFIVVWARVFIFVYPLGIPICYFWILFQQKEDLNPSLGNEFIGVLIDEINSTADEYINEDVPKNIGLKFQNIKEDIRNEKDTVQILKFLFVDYKPHLWWWEVIECLRRLMLTGMLVFFEDESDIQILVGICISLFSIFMYSHFKPLLNDNDNWFSEAVQWATFHILFLALLLTVNSSVSDRSVVGVIMTFIFFAPFANLLFVIWNCCKKKENVQNQDTFDNPSDTLRESLLNSPDRESIDQESIEHVHTPRSTELASP